MRSLKKFRKVFLGLISLTCFLLALESYAQVLQETFRENLADFEISTPNPQWRFAPRSVEPGSLRASLSFESEVDQFIPNVNVQLLAIAEKNQGLKSILKKELDSLGKNFEVISQKKITHRNQKGYEIILKENQHQLQFLQWIFIKKTKRFTISCSSKINSWERMEKDFREILASFEMH